MKAVEVKIKWKIESIRPLHLLKLTEDIKKSLSFYLRSRYEDFYEGDIHTEVTSLFYEKGWVEAEIAFNDDPPMSASIFKESLPEATFNALQELIESEAVDVLMEADILNFVPYYDQEYFYDKDDDEEYYSVQLYKPDCQIEVVDVKFNPEFYGQQRLPLI